MLNRYPANDFSLDNRIIFGFITKTLRLRHFDLGLTNRLVNLFCPFSHSLQHFLTLRGARKPGRCLILPPQ